MSIASVEVSLASLAGKVDRIRYLVNGSATVYLVKQAEAKQEFMGTYPDLPLIWDDVYGCYRLERSIGQLRIVMVYLKEAEVEVTEIEDVCVRSATDHARHKLATALVAASNRLAFALRKAGYQVCHHDAIDGNPEYTRAVCQLALETVLQQMEDDPPYDTRQLLQEEDENSELPNFDLALDRVNEEMRGCMKGLCDGMDYLLGGGVVSRGCGDSGGAVVSGGDAGIDYVSRVAE